MIRLQYGVAGPKTPSTDQSVVLHPIVNNVDSVDHVTYLAQWLDVSGRNAILHPTTTEVNSTITTFPISE